MAYQPPGLTTQSASLTHNPTVYYKREALDQVKQMFRFAGVCEPDDIPKRNGRTVQWYRYSNMVANTTPSSEAVGNSLSQTTTTVSAVVEQYSDFITRSTLLDETSIDDGVANDVRELSYRAALTVDTICRIEADSNAGAILAMLGAAFSAADVRHCVADLGANNVRPREGDDFVGIIHPYIVYDLQSDNTAGGFIDALRYATPEKMISGEVGKIAGTRFVGSTNVGTSGAAPNVLYETYIFGKGGIGIVDLAGSGPSRVVDPMKQSFRIAVGKGGPTIADPEGNIGHFASYRFVFTVQTLDTTTLRYRRKQADATLV